MTALTHRRPNRRLAQLLRRSLRTLVPLSLVFALLFVDFSRALPKELPFDIPSNAMLRTRLNLELQRLAIQFERFGPQAATAQTPNYPFTHYWNYRTTTTPALPSNDGWSTYFLKEKNILYVGTASGVTAIDFLNNRHIANFNTPTRVNAITANGGEVAIATEGSGVYVLSESLGQIARYTQPQLHWIWGDYVSDVALVKTPSRNLLIATGVYSSGVTIIDRTNADTPSYYRFLDNNAHSVEFDTVGDDLYVAYSNGGNPGGVARVPWRGNGHPINQELLTFLGQDQYGRWVYQASHDRWLRGPEPVTDPPGNIDYELGRVYYGAQPQTAPRASYTFWGLAGEYSPGVGPEAVDYYRQTSTPALASNTAHHVLWHADTNAFYALDQGHWFFGGAAVTRVKGGVATVYTNSTPGMSGSGSVYKRTAKHGDDLFVATSNGVSRLNETTGQGTIANASTINQGSYDTRDVAVDGPVVFTADGSNGSEILYRGTAQDAANRLGRGTCDTRPLISNEVSACNGNPSYSDTDLTLPGKNLAFAFQRSFNDRDERLGPLGPGWTHSLDMAITFNPFNTVAVVRKGDGRRDTYQKQADGSFLGQVGVFDTLVLNGDGTYTVTQKDQTKLNFTANGRFTSMVDRNGNTISLTYNASGQLTTITDSAGRTITLTLDGQGRITALTDPTNRAWTYAYNAGGRLQSVTNPLNGSTQYTYDTAGRLLTVTDARNNVVLTNTYGAFGRLDQQKDALNHNTSYWLNTHPISMEITDRRGKKTTYLLDDQGRHKEMRDHLGNKVEYTYVGTTTQRASMKDRRGNTTSYTWDSRGNLLMVTDPLGKTTTMTYNAQNFPTSVTDALNRTTTYSYDTKGNLTGILDPLNRTWTLTYNTAGQLLTVTDPLNRVTTYGYDSQGNRTSVTDALNKSSTAIYDSLGRPTSVTDALNHTTSYTYNALNRLTTITDAKNGVTTLAYDANGNLTSVTDPLNRVTTSTYDARNLRTAMTDPLNGVTQYQYDAAGNLTRVTDPMNFQTNYEYDDLNRLTKITDPLNAVTQFGYDAEGSRTTITDAGNHVWTFTYDAARRLTSAKDPLNNTSSYTYDFNGNLLTATDPMNRVTTYTYNAMAQVESITNALNQTTTFAYDAAGNRTSVTDALNRTTTFTYTARNQMATMVDPMNRTTTLSYDDAGRLISVTDAGNNVWSYVYDELNRLTQAKDPLNNTTTIARDAVGNVTSVTDALNHTTTYTYDALNRLTRTTDALRACLGNHRQS